MTRLSLADLHEESKKIGWFHSIDLGDGHWTRGLKTSEQMQHELASWRFPADLSGKTLLDIGCADGGFSVAAIRRGANSVLAIDERMTGGMHFLLRNQIFPIEYKTIELFSNSFMDLPIFDVVIFTGVLYHVQEPLEALKRVRAKVRELAILETHVNESLGISAPYMIYYEKDELGKDPTNWWAPNTLCLEAILRTAGFHATRVFRDTPNPGNARVCYHLQPQEGSVYGRIIGSATGSHNLAEEYLARAGGYYERIVELENELAELKSTSGVRPQLARARFCARLANRIMQFFK